MRVLHLGKYFAPAHGGMERFLADLLGAQRSRGVDAAALVHASGADLGEGEPPWLMRCPVWLRLLFAPISPAYPLWLARALARHRPQVLHLHLPNPSVFWCLLSPAARRLPWVVHWHSDVTPSRFRLGLRLAYPFYRVFQRALLERADAIVVTSPPYLDTSLPLAPYRHKCTVIPLGLDPARLPEAADLPQGPGPDWLPGRFRLLAIGRLTYYKGYETLVRAVAGLEDMDLLIVGEGEERPHLEAVLAQLGHPPGIRLAGGADDATCARLLATCDLFCLPSRERTEAFGIVLMEAMRYGKPLLVSDIPGSGVTWVARQEVNARQVPVEAVNAWRQALVALAADPAARARLGRAGRQRFQSDFHIGSVTHRLDGLYRALVPEEQGEAATHPTAAPSLPLIVIPALNEAASVGQVVARVRQQGFPHVVVVDDGSQDDTAEQARRQGARVLTPPIPQGAWGAMQTGIRYALRHGYPGVITMDADGQHEPAHLAELLAAGRQADVVIGAYPLRGSRPRRLAWAYFRRLTGFAYEDLTSGFRYYNRRACQVLARNEATLLDYQDVGVLLLLHKAGLGVREIPVTMSPRQHGASRVFSSWWTVARYMAETTLLCLARWNIRPPRA